MSLSEKRLADIRERHRVGLGLERPGDVAALLREVERLRAGIEEQAERWELARELWAGHNGAEWSICNTGAIEARNLLNPYRAGGE